jgi:hypothetical protein
MNQTPTFDDNNDTTTCKRCVSCAKQIHSSQIKFCDNCEYTEKMYKQLENEITFIIEGKLAPNTNYYPSHSFFEKNTFTGVTDDVGDSEYNDNYLPELTESQKNKLFEKSSLNCVCVLCSNELITADTHTKYCKTCSQIMLKAGWPV